MISFIVSLCCLWLSLTAFSCRVDGNQPAPAWGKKAQDAAEKRALVARHRAEKARAEAQKAAKARADRRKKPEQEPAVAKVIEVEVTPVEGLKSDLYQVMHPRLSFLRSFFVPSLSCAFASLCRFDMLCRCLCHSLYILFHYL